MSNKNKNKNKNKNQKKNINKTILKDNNTNNNGLSKEALERQKIRKEKHIWFWIIFLPPIGIYKSIKHKAFSKVVNILLTIILSLVVITTVDVMINPYRVIEMNVKKIVEKNELGTIRQSVKIGSYNGKYIVYNVITSEGIYDLYLSGKNGKTVNAIIKTAPDRTLIYENNFEVEHKDVYSEILRFFNENDNVEKFGEVEEVLYGENNCQLIKTTQGTFEFVLHYGQVVEVNKQVEGDIYEKVYEREPILYLPPKLEKIMKQREDKLGKVEKVIAYSVDEEQISYQVLMDNGNYHKLTINNNKEIIIYDSDRNNDKKDDNSNLNDSTEEEFDDEEDNSEDITEDEVEIEQNSVEEDTSNNIDSEVYMNFFN